MPYTFNPLSETFDFYQEPTPGGTSGQVQFNNSGVLGGVSTTAVDGSGNITFSGRWVQSTNGAASAPATSLTGTWFTGGTSTTTKPQVLIEPIGATSTNWSTSGTGLGINAPAGFSGNFLDIHLNGVKYFGVSTSRLDFRLAGGAFFGMTFPSGYLNMLDYDGNTIFSFERRSNAMGLNLIQTNLSWGTDYFTPDLTLSRDAANNLALRRGTNAQTFRVYNTFTSATNFERAKIEWSSNTLRVGTEKGSAGGTARDMELQTDGTTRLAVDTVGSIRVTTALTVATLPAAPAVGMVARVTDATAPVMGATVVGGGAAAALCWYNGANWTVIGI